MRLRSRTIRIAFFIACLCITFTLLRLQAGPQRRQQQTRLKQSIDEGHRIRLPQTTYSKIRQAGDRGRVSPDLSIDRVILTLKSDPEREMDLENFLAQQQDRSSPHFHEWLSPQQFGEQFGVSSADIDVIVQWLKSHGMQVNQVSNGHREIEFSGTARQIEEALQTEIHNYELNGELHVANANDISIPAALEPVVSGVISLHDFTRKPKSHRHEPVVNFTFGGNHAMVPYDFATIYDLAALWGEGLDGTGQTIAVVGRSNIDPNDVVTFRSQNGLPPNAPEIIVNGTDPGVFSMYEEAEADLDVQWSGAVAKGAKIRFVVSKSTSSTDGSILSEIYIVNNNVAPVLTTSFGFCEVVSASTSRFYANLWQQAAAEGISVFVASGDSGVASCDDASATAAKQGLSVDGEASTPYNVAVGGTQFNENGSNSLYWNTTNNLQNRSSAKTYIPEVAWNESGTAGLWSSGGGVSIVHATPSWQTGFGVPVVDPGTPNQHHRYLPDVSLTAAGHDGYAAMQRGSLTFFSGTSASAPAFAGIMAIVNQATNQANGNPNPHLYALAAQVPAVFHDVTSGTNAVPCVAGSPGCSDGTLTGYTATPGYDLVTGWGSVDAYLFVHAWAGTTTPPPPVMITTSSTLSSTAAGTALSVNLAASGGIPPYQWVATSGSLPAGLTLDPSGVLSGTPTTPGSYNFTISVTDGNGAGTSQTFQITITSPVSGGGSSSSSTTAAVYHVFPQFADGRVSDGTYYRTTLMISNTSSNNAACTLQLHGLSIIGFSSSYSVTANGWMIASTSGTQPFQSGYATLQCSTKVEAQLLYSYYLPNGVKLSEATVFSSPSSSSVKVIADQLEGAQLGLAIANDSDQSVTYTISVAGISGPGFTLPGRTSISRFLNQFVPALPANGIGVVQVNSSNGTASVVGLRFTGSIFTTIPEITAASATANTYHVFPQFADGQFPDGTFYRTTRMYINLSPTATTCTTQLRGVSTDGNTGFTANLQPGTFVVAPTNGTQTFQAGYMTMNCPSSPVDAQELYSYYAANGAKLSEATVFSSPSAKTVQILADGREGAQIGLAIANDSDQPNSYNIVITDTNGVVLGSAVQTLDPRSSVAKFLTDFVALPADYVGRVAVSSNSGTASIIGLRYTGSVFTTIPESIAQ
jgi:pseudomonalisin